MCSGNNEEVILYVGVEECFKENVSSKLHLERWRKFTRKESVVGILNRGNSVCQ